MNEEKKYYGAVCYSTKIFGSLLDTIKSAKKQGHYSMNGVTMKCADLLAGKLKSITMVGGKVTAFKVERFGIIAEMEISDGKLTAVNMERMAA